MDNLRPKVSVIIPVYKAEQYIEKCARSLFEQTLDDIEYIFINDYTPDKSMDVLQKVIEEYPYRKHQIKFIEHEKNKGTATSRNSGLSATTGEYVIHCDSDDWIEPEMYEDMYDNAIKGKKDIVWCDYFSGPPDKMNYYKQNASENKMDCINAMLTGGGLQLHLWDKLIKRSLYTDNNIRFPDGLNIREDWVVIIQLFYFADKFLHINKAYYYYIIRNTSISNNRKDWDKYNHNIKDRIKALELITAFLKNNNVLNEFESALNTAKIHLKHWILMQTKNKRKWLNIFPEANKTNYFNLPKVHPARLAMGLALKKCTVGYVLLEKISNILIFINIKRIY